MRSERTEMYLRAAADAFFNARLLGHAFISSLKQKKKSFLRGASSPPLLATESDNQNPTLEMGSAGLVLATETAIGKYPMECVSFLKKIINTFKKFQ